MAPVTYISREEADNLVRSIPNTPGVFPSVATAGCTPHEEYYVRVYIQDVVAQLPESIRNHPSIQLVYVVRPPQS
jgi:hypothetical protein